MTASQVIVVNAYKLAETPAGYTPVYVGRRRSYRPEFGDDFSLLGNPYTLRSGYTRDQAVDLYAPWLERAPSHVRRAFDVLRERVRTERVALVCFCAPQRCHANVIKTQLEAAQ